MKTITFSTLLYGFCLFMACASPPKIQTNPASYLALGDSYTIGESVPSSQRWPIQLADKLNAKGNKIEEPKIIARTGWRVDNLLSAMDADQELTDGKYDLVSVLIGVNNQFQGRSLEEFETDLHTILDRAEKLCKQGKKGVFVLSIPDYGATPFGADQADEIGKAIDDWNSLYKTVSEAHGLDYYDITPISRQGTKDGSMVAGDGLHPSGKQYGLWADQILSDVSQKLP